MRKKSNDPKWRKVLLGEEKLPKDYSERYMRYEIRERAKKAMDNLTEILGKLPDISKHPEREYALIFKNEPRYFGMIKACNEAYRTSYKSKRKLANEENWGPLQKALLSAGIFVPDKEMFEPERRDAWWKELKRKGKKAGIDYIEHLRLQVLAQKQMPKPKWTATCPKCGLEQPPTIRIDPCKKCGFSGPVIPDLYMP